MNRKRIRGMFHVAPLSILRFGAVMSIAALVNHANAQVVQVQSVVDMAGMRMSAATLVGITAGGQSVTGINRGPGGHLVNHAGFLTAMILKPALDTDGDGICNELDIDNDNDGIEDLVEILGTTSVPAAATDPNNADTDGDKASDSDEVIAGTDPREIGSVLEMTGIRFENGGIRVTWKGGSSARQILMRRSALSSPSEEWEPIFTNEPPTLTTMTILDPNGMNNIYYYKIKVERP